MRNVYPNMWSLVFTFCIVLETAASRPPDFSIKNSSFKSPGITEAIEPPCIEFRETSGISSHISAQVDAMTAAYAVYKTALLRGIHKEVEAALDQLFLSATDLNVRLYKVLIRSVAHPILAEYLELFHGPRFEPYAFLLIDRRDHDANFLIRIVQNSALGVYVRLYALGLLAEDIHDIILPSSLQQAIRSLMEEMTPTSVQEFFEQVLLPQQLSRAMAAVLDIATLLDRHNVHQNKSDILKNVKTLMRSAA